MVDASEAYTSRRWTPSPGNPLPFGPRDSGVDRQEIVDTLHRMLDCHELLKGFSVHLKLALENRIWERERVFAGGTRQPPMALHAFVHEHYPVGLGVSYELIENLIRGDRETVALWADVARREPRGPHVRSSGTGSQSVNASALKDMKFAPIRYVIPGYIAEGCSLLAGAPKLGKSWMVLDMAIAKATGGRCLGSVETPEAEDVLYLALEDNFRRLQSRMDRLMLVGTPWPERLTFSTSWPRANEGGLDKIREWARERDKPRLVVIDVLTAFRPPVSPKDNAYTADYNAVKVMTELAAALGVAIVIVHHTRKSRDQVDPFDRVSGTLGLSGAADSALILDRDGQGVTLYGRGRDIPEIETAMQFNKDACRWSVMGRAAEVHQSDARKAVTEVLLVTTEPMSPVTIAEATGQTRGSTKTLLFRMFTKGEVLKTAKGAYVHPSRTDLLDPP